MTTAIQRLQTIAERNRERVFAIDAKTGEALTYRVFHKRAVAVACDLARWGIGPGDRLAILLENSGALAVLYFACLYAGIVAVPINPTLSRQNIAFIVRTSRAKLLVASPATAKHVSDGAASIDMLVLDDGSAGAADGGWNFASLEPDTDFVPFANAQDDDVAVIMYTSGTTADPRGVAHSIANFVGNGQLFIDRLRLRPDHRFYVSFAMTYMAGFFNSMMVPFVAEASIVIGPAFDARTALKFWQPAQQHGVNVLWLPPTALTVLMQLDRNGIGEAFCRDHIDLALVATAPLPTALRKEFEGQFGTDLFQSYGLSEVLFIATNDPFDPVAEDVAGRVLDGLDVRVLDDAGAPLPAGEEGEIAIVTPHLMTGYVDAETGEVDPLNPLQVFATGDIGVLSGRGELRITGRKKDIIIRGGVNISSASIEDVIYRHPAVAECAVVGVPHQVYGEEPVVAIRMVEGRNFDEVRADLMRTCKSEISAATQPADIIEFKDFPRSSSGKIQKFAVRAEVIKRLEPASGQTAEAASP